MTYRSDYQDVSREFFWTLPRGLGAAFVTTVAVFLLLVAVTPLTIGFGWYSGEAGLRSFSHVKATYAEGYDDVRALDALAGNICITRTAITQAAGDLNAVSQRQSQLLALEGRFNSLRGEYDAYMQDHFRGGVIHPAALPLPYPTLNTKVGGC